MFLESFGHSLCILPGSSISSEGWRAGWMSDLGGEWVTELGGDLHNNKLSCDLGGRQRSRQRAALKGKYARQSPANGWAAIGG